MSEKRRFLIQFDVCITYAVRIDATSAKEAKELFTLEYENGILSAYDQCREVDVESPCNIAVTPIIEGIDEHTFIPLYNPEEN